MRKRERERVKMGEDEMEDSKLAGSIVEKNVVGGVEEVEGEGLPLSSLLTRSDLNFFFFSLGKITLLSLIKGLESLFLPSLKTAFYILLSLKNSVLKI